MKIDRNKKTNSGVDPYLLVCLFPLRPSRGGGRFPAPHGLGTAGAGCALGAAAAAAVAAGFARDAGVETAAGEASQRSRGD